MQLQSVNIKARAADAPNVLNHYIDGALMDGEVYLSDFVFPGRVEIQRTIVSPQYAPDYEDGEIIIETADNNVINIVVPQGERTVTSEDNLTIHLGDTMKIYCEKAGGMQSVNITIWYLFT